MMFLCARDVIHRSTLSAGSAKLRRLVPVWLVLLVGCLLLAPEARAADAVVISDTDEALGANAAPQPDFVSLDFVSSDERPQTAPPRSVVRDEQLLPVAATAATTAAATARLEQVVAQSQPPAITDLPPIPPVPGQPDADLPVAPRIEVDAVIPDQPSQQVVPNVQSLLDPFNRIDGFSQEFNGIFLPDVQGTRIYSGKKNEVIDLQDRPPIANNNWRQVFQRTPSLVIAEEASPLVSIGYRGLDPHRAQFMQVLMDGVPIHADMVGYPEAYFTPPLQVIDHIDFLYGGASLLYGPQPGGALNFITKSPYTDGPFALETQQLFGSFNFFSTYNAVSGTHGPLGYYVYQHHRDGRGFRQSNSDFDVDYFGAKVVMQTSDVSRLTLNVDFYGESHGEPGGLSWDEFQNDPTQTTRLYDMFQLKRYSMYAIYQEELNPDTYFEFRGWATYYSRFSRRQRGGGFGIPPANPPVGNALQADFELQQFYTLGIEPRLRRDWGAANTFTMGTQYYHTDSPRRDTRGPFDARDSLGWIPFGPNQQQRLNERTVNYFSVFSENRFKWDRLSITPGVRVDNIWQHVTEYQNEQKRVAGEPLLDEGVFNAAPLFGAGATYDFFEQELLLQGYSNISQAYRPIIFTQAVPLQPGQIVAGNLQDGTSWQAEVGMRSRPYDGLTFDTSLFYLDFSNQIGTIGPVIMNVGDSRHRGAEFLVEYDLLQWNDPFTGGGNRSDGLGRFGFFTTAMFLDARYYRGPSAGMRAQYAPDYTGRFGLTYNTGRAQAMFGGTYLSSHYADSAQTPNRYIPSYDVWDLNGQYFFTPRVYVTGGINNMFDKKYYARVRNDGIDPALPRNIYGGFGITF